MEQNPFPTSPANQNNAMSRGVDSAGNAMHSTIDKMADPARQALDQVSSAAHDTVEKIASGAANTVNRFSEQTRRLTEAPAKALESSKYWVQDRPLEAVGAALAIGFIIGRLTAR